MRNILTPSRPAGSALLLVARVVLGLILVAHGWQKFTEWTLAGTGQAFAGMGVPLPEVSAVVAAVVELLGGVLLIAGAFTSVVGIIVALEMVGAAVLVHITNGVFIDKNGWELVGAIAAAALALAVAGAGKWSVDGLLFKRFGRNDATPARERELVDAR